jgi:ABC-type transporter Mla MlaB component
VLDALPEGKAMTLELGSVPAIDHSVAEALRQWLLRQRQRGGSVELIGNSRHLRQLAV